MFGKLTTSLEKMYCSIWLFLIFFCHILDTRSSKEISIMMSGLWKRIEIIAFLLVLAILDTNASLGKIYLLLISNSL